MTITEFQVNGLDHVQLAMPAGEEQRARDFYSGILGLTEVPKPPNLAKRGGTWFEGGTLRVHIGVEADFRPAKKAHPAFLVRNLAAAARHLERFGVTIITDEPLEGYHRIYVHDPFGNRIELLEPHSSSHEQ
jgi:catechol 2,3-dioxygenase-like lactoylglutathione lyase family enzyme